MNAPRGRALHALKPRRPGPPASPNLAPSAAGPSQPPAAGKGPRLLASAKNFAARTLELVIGNPAQADQAAHWRLEIDSRERQIIDWFAPAKRAAFEAHAAICGQEREALAPYRRARRTLDSRLAAWHLHDADRAHVDQRSESSAQTHLSAVAGVSFREYWHAQVTDKRAFVRAVAANPELLNLIEPNLAALAHLARAQQGALRLAGVRVWRERTVAAKPHPVASALGTQTSPRATARAKIHP